MADGSQPPISSIPQLPVGPTPERRERKRLRAVLRPFEQKRPVLAWTLVTVDLGLYAVAFAASAATTNPLTDVVLAFVLAVMMFRASALGHDASHGALVDGRRANRWIARAVHLPSWTVECQWDFTHGIHHGFTNQQGHDFLWAPLSPQAYGMLPRWRQWAERLFRSPLGHGVYFLTQVWWRALFLFSPANKMLRSSPRRWLDTGLLVGFIALQGAVLALLNPTLAGFALAVLFAVALPLLLWAWLAGLVSYIQHTSPDIAWDDEAEREEWSTMIAGLEQTRIMTLPRPLSWLLHEPMEHVTHHLSVRIPLYNARAARRAVMQAFPGRVRVEAYAIKALLRTARTCKLFDPAGRCWVPFPSNVADPAKGMTP